MHFNAIRFCCRALLVGAATLGMAAAQTQDSSGDGLLKGKFNFRHLAMQIVDQNNNPTDISAIFGTITFDGAGNYTGAATSIDPSVSTGAPQPLALNGKYFIGANGTGFLTNPLFPTDPAAYIYGAVAQGVFTGSSTESEQDTNELNDIFIAIPAGTPPTNASFTGAFQTVVLDFPASASDATKNAQFKLTPDGKGGLGSLSVTGQAANVPASENSPITQTVSGATYNFNADGSATLTVPLPSSATAATAMFTGTKTMFESADGNFILGWTSGGYDIFFGVKALAAAGTNSLSAGLYFTAALEDSPAFYGADSYYGGTDNTGDNAGDAVVHQRLNIPAELSLDYGTDDQISLNSDGTTSTDFNGYDYFFGAGGQAFVAMGTSGLYSLQVGMHAPAFSGSGVYLNPIGVANAASYQPITASLAPGEDIALFGTGLAAAPASVQGGNVFPTSLGGVSVTIDGIACPLYSVSPTQINAVVPYAVASNQTALANIQVTNNGVQSNVVQMYLTDSAPGSFSQNQNGIGLAAALHGATNQLITPANPALGNEYISLYLTGLGTVTPAILDGAVGPSSPLSYSDLYTSGNLAVYFNDYNPLGSVANPGTIQFAGLVPTLAGLYQINVQVPSTGLGSGDNVYVEFVTDASDVNQIQIPFGFGSSGAARPQARPTRTQVIQTIRSHPKRTVNRRARAVTIAP